MAGALHYFRCKCGHTFDEALGAYGCANCGGERGPARYVTRQRMKSRRRAIGSPTKAQQARQDRQREHGCAMCLLLGLARDACGPVRVHHRTVGDLHGNKQLGQDATVALGDWHHQGVLMTDYPTIDAMRARFGPSLAHHKREFVELIAEKLGERSTAALQAWQEAQA